MLEATEINSAANAGESGVMIEDMAAQQVIALGMSQRAQDLLRTLLDSTATVEAILPDDLPPAETIESLEICCRAFASTTAVRERLKPIIGKLLLMVQAKPSIYKRRGFATFELFISEFVEKKLGVSRTDCYNSKRIVAKLPDLTPEAFVEIGSGKLRVLVQAFPGDDQPVPKKYLAFAKKNTEDDLRDKLEADSLLSPGETQPYLLQVKTNKALGKRWRDWCKNPEVQKKAESNRPAKILEAMLDECASSWRI